MENKSNIWWWVVGVIIVIAVVWFAVENKGPVIEGTGPIKIGAILPLTGEATVYGEPMRNVIALAIEEINKEGGIGGRDLEVIYEDGKCTGISGANAAQKLVNIDKVKVILGGVCSSETLSAIPITEQGKVFLFSGAASGPSLTGAGKFFARDYPSDAGQGKALADAAFKDNGWKKVAIIQEKSDYALGIYKAFLSRFEELGGEIVKEEFPSGAADFRSQLTKLKFGNPDALFITVQAIPSAERIVKQMNELNWKLPLLGSDVIGAAGSDVLSKNAEAFEGMLSAQFTENVSDPKFQRLLAAYKQKYGTDVAYQSYAQTVYDTVYIIRDAIQKVGYDGEKIADWVRSLENWQGASGPVTIGENGDRIGGHIVNVIKSGKAELYVK